MIRSGHRHAVLLTVQALVALVAASACSPSRRPVEREPDAGSDAGEDTDLPWDTGTDTDVLVLEPELLLEYPDLPTYIDQELMLAATFDGEHVAVSWPDVYTAELSIMVRDAVFFTFPWDSPQDVMVGSFAEEAPACDAPYGTSVFSTSQPYPHPDGFLLLHAPGGFMSDCEAVQTLWDADANLINGPHAFAGLFSNDGGWRPLSPQGIALAGGEVMTGSMNGEGLDTASAADGVVHVDIDSWAALGGHERLVGLTIPWPFDPEGLDGKSIRSIPVGTSIHLHDGVFTVLGLETTSLEDYSDVIQGSLLVRVDADGNVVQDLGQIADDTPPIPLGFEDTSYSLSWYSFESSGESILEVAMTMYYELAGFAEYDPSVADPYTARLWSRVIDFDGTPLTEWTDLAEYQSHIEAVQVPLAWSGQYYAACFIEPFETFRMIVMNAHGESLSSPFDLFWMIPPVDGHGLVCDVVAIDEDTFVAILGVYTEPPQAYKNGLWATRVDVNLPIE